MAPHCALLASTALERLQHVPTAFWAKLGLVVLGLVVVVIALRKLMEVNKFILGGVVFVAGGLIWFNWIYHRTEPKFLTPVIDRIAPFFPSAGAYETKQASTPDAGKK